MFLDIYKFDDKVDTLDFNDYKFGIIVDGNWVLGLDVAKPGSMDHTVYMSMDFKFKIRGFNTFISPKAVVEVAELPKPVNPSEIREIIYR
jgi:hypothetical protein